MAQCCHNAHSTHPYGRWHRYSPSITPPGIDILCHLPLQFSPLDMLFTSHPICTGLGWNVIGFSQWNCSEGTMDDLFPLFPSVLLPSPREGPTLEACWYQQNARLMEQTWPNPQLGAMPNRAQPRSAKPQPAHEQKNKKLELIIVHHRVLEWFC